MLRVSLLAHLLTPETSPTGVNCRVDGEVLRVHFGVDRKDSSVIVL